MCVCVRKHLCICVFVLIDNNVSPIAWVLVNFCCHKNKNYTRSKLDNLISVSEMKEEVKLKQFNELIKKMKEAERYDLLQAL